MQTHHCARSVYSSCWCGDTHMNVFESQYHKCSCVCTVRSPRFEYIDCAVISFSNVLSCGYLYVSFVWVSPNPRTHANREKAVQCDHRCCLFVGVDRGSVQAIPPDLSRRATVRTHIHRQHTPLEPSIAFIVFLPEAPTCPRHTDPPLCQEYLFVPRVDGRHTHERV